MSNYLYDKFFGKYRILVPIDRRTNDFPRNRRGEPDTDDFYIPCRKYGKESGQIYHYGQNLLGVLVKGLIRYRRLLKLCEENNIVISNLREGDDECSFTFSAKDFDFIAEFMGAVTQGKNIRPFSIKNLPKSMYEIPPENIKEYREILDSLENNDKLIVSQLTDEFIRKTFGKKSAVDIRLHKMSRQKREYIHMMGKWDNYIKFLKERLE